MERKHLFSTGEKPPAEPEVKLLVSGVVAEKNQANTDNKWQQTPADKTEMRGWFTFSREDLCSQLSANTVLSTWR